MSLKLTTKQSQSSPKSFPTRNKNKSKAYLQRAVVVAVAVVAAVAVAVVAVPVRYGCFCYCCCCCCCCCSFHSLTKQSSCPQRRPTKIQKTSRQHLHPPMLLEQSSHFLGRARISQLYLQCSRTLFTLSSTSPFTLPRDEEVQVCFCNTQIFAIPSSLSEGGWHQQAFLCVVHVLIQGSVRSVTSSDFSTGTLPSIWRS